MLSVLRAGRPDLVPVVSDNSTEAGQRERLEAFCARRGVTYVRPPEPLPMAPHWEWLRLQIRDRIAPTHVSYLTDRMVFTAAGLPEVASIAAREPAHVLSYRHDRVNDLEAPVELVQSQWTGRLLELDCRRLIELSSRGAYGDHLPRMLNCVVPATLLDELERRFGAVFEPASPDYRFAYRCLAVRDTILHLDRACLVHHGMTRSAGISFVRGRPNEAITGFWRSLESERFGDTPEPRLETVANAIFQEYCAVRGETGGERFPPLVPGPYLRVNAISASRMEDAEWRSRTLAILRERGWSRRREARYLLGDAAAYAAYFARHPGALARSLKRQLWDRPPGTPAASILRRRGLEPPLRDELRFPDSASAIAHNDEHPRPRTPYAWPAEPLRRAGAIVSSRPPRP